MAEPRRFIVGGPFDVPTRGAARRRSLDRPAAKELWNGEAAEWAADIGCYVFSLRRGRGYLPLYIGKTCRSFAAECFTDRNYRLLHEAMDGEMGTLVMFLLAYEYTRGRVNEGVVGDLERYLVEAAIDRNPQLKNTVFTSKTPGFAIPGIHRRPGRPSSAAIELDRALSLRNRSRG